MNRIIVIALGLAMSASLAAEPAMAAVIFQFGEDQVRLDYRSPNQTSVVDFVEFTVSPSVDVVNFPDQNTGTILDFSPNRIDISFSKSGSFQGSADGVGGAQFLGFRIADLNNTNADFEEIEIDPFTTLSGFQNNRILDFGIDEFFLDFQGLAYDDTSFVRLNLNGGPAVPTVVPEPGTLAFLGVGGLGMAILRRRRHKQDAEVLEPATA